MDVVHRNFIFACTDMYCGSEKEVCIVLPTGTYDSYEAQDSGMNISRVIFVKGIIRP